MKARILVLLLIALVGSVYAAEPKNEPPIKIEEAIERAKDYIKTQKIDVSKRHISSAKFEPESHRSFWRITWELDANYNPAIKTLGGQVFVNVYLDRRVEATYGE